MLHSSADRLEEGECDQGGCRHRKGLALGDVMKDCLQPDDERGKDPEEHPAEDCP